jgi:hypothetical protein
MGKKNKEKVEIVSSRDVKKRGKKDGKDWRWKPWRPLPGWPVWETIGSDPPVNQKKPSEYEKKLLEGAEENLSRIAQDWSAMDEALHKNCMDAEDRYKTAKKNIGINDSGDIVTAEKEYRNAQNAQNKYEDTKNKFHIQPLPHISKSRYWLLFIPMLIGEAVFNGLVFSVVGQSQTDTIIMAITVVIAIPVLSDFIGRKLRLEKKSKTTIGVMIGAAIILFAALITIAVFREKFFEANKIVEALGIKWDTNSITLSLIVLNILLSAAFVILAYESGYKNPHEYKLAKTNFEEAEKSLKKAEDRLKKHEEKPDAVNKALVNAQLEFNKAHAERENRFENMHYKAEEERDKWVRLVQDYRAANMQARRKKEKPTSFDKDPEDLINIPDSLQNLDCNNCCYDEERK